MVGVKFHDRGPTKTVKIQGDGNCLFRAWSWWMCGHQDNHGPFRAEVCKFIRARKNAHLVKPMISYNSGLGYVSNTEMARDRTYGSHVELQMMAYMLKCNVYVYLVDKDCATPRWTAFLHEIKPSKKSQSNERALYFLNNNKHYEPIISV